MDILSQDIMYLPGVGPKRKEILSKELGIWSYRDLLEYFPYKYVDRTKIYLLSELSADMPFVQVKCKILSYEEFEVGKRRKRIVAHATDGYGICDIVWFNGTKYVYQNYQINKEYIIFGKPTYYNGRFQFSHPDIDDASQLQLNDMGMQPFYITTEKMKKAGITSRAMEKLTKTLLSKLTTPLDETLPSFITRFYTHNLPFELTGAQKRVMHEIRADMMSGKQMNRLLQGDVGSGKTLVALMSMLIAIDNGYQACMMAPTEILAEQHLQTIKEFLKGMNLRIELLTGIVKGKKRKEVLAGLLDGCVHIVVGTHAIIEDKVQFQNLGMAVVDEQHRFGVEQRAKLWSKSDNPPHILVMTATPIPRTLAMTIYGDLDVSIIDELPPGRKPIQTIHKYDDQMTSLYQGIRQQIKLGRQVYIVYPLIKESERIDLKNLEDGYAAMCEIFPDFKLSKIHGKMKDKEKEAEMQMFVSGETQILVATTVIEVGVNVPNASVMIILDAQRFGLSQLHQLRGRVGRGAEQSYCILVTNRKLTKETSKRIDIMCDTNDGFEIAEADLKLRGPGDLEGTQQSGIAFDLKIADIARDGQLVQMAREEAQKIIDSDPTCQKNEYKLLWDRLKALRKTNINWAAIS